MASGSNVPWPLNQRKLEDRHLAQQSLFDFPKVSIPTVYLRSHVIHRIIVKHTEHIGEAKILLD
ncbi:MAG: hypothetical protein HOJ22_00955 [Chloroflexi bacterium]|nr:hypothetical protein [Chloroflexota bacterium]